MDKCFEFKVKNSCSQRYEFGCVDDSYPYPIHVAKIEDLDFFFPLGYSRSYLNNHQIKI